MSLIETCVAYCDNKCGEIITLDPHNNQKFRQLTKQGWSFREVRENEWEMKVYCPKCTSALAKP